MEEAQKNPEYLKVLIHFIDYYSYPEAVLESIPQDAKIEEMREALIFAFQQLKLQLGILTNVKLLSKFFTLVTLSFSYE